MRVKKCAIFCSTESIFDRQYSSEAIYWFNMGAMEFQNKDLRGIEKRGVPKTLFNISSLFLSCISF
jgi:hypothetical protein